jgi:trans-aconitate methyltransferase
MPSRRMSSSDKAPAQTWSPDTYDEHARFVSDLAGEVLNWLAPRPGERILDLGCGDGVLTEQLKNRGCRVIGVDASAGMIAAARARGLDARVADAHELAFDGEFDAVFSNAALHWMIKPGKVLDGVARALGPDGRFVAEFGGHGNVAAITTAMRAVAKSRGGDQELAGPWFFPSVDDYRRLLEQKGFNVKRIGLFPRPTLLKTGMRSWLKLFRQPFFEQFGDAMGDALAEAEALLKPSLCDAGGRWTADYVRLRVEAVRP